MKPLVKIIYVTLLILITFLSTSLAQNNENPDSLGTGNLVVKFTGCNSDAGLIMIALNNSKENYNSNAAFKYGGAPIKDGNAQYVFENIPFGEYAVKCYHDENSNQKMDTNMMGIPKESYGFSNNVRGNFGPASYEDAKFQFNKNEQVITIEIN